MHDLFQSVAGRTPAAVGKDPWLNVWMPTTHSTGIQDAALFHELTTGAWAGVDFFMMLFDTARNWGDTAMPGYRRPCRACCPCR